MKADFFEEDFDDAALDRWNDGALDACRHKPAASDDPDYCAGYAEGLELRKVRAVMPHRPEGYYHCAPGTFDPTGENIAPELLA